MTGAWIKFAGQRPFWLIVGSVVLLVAAVVWRGPVLGKIGAFLDVGVAPQRVDYVMVLPGGPQTRPFVAAAMVRSGLAERVLVPKNAASPKIRDGIAAAPHEVTKRVLSARGISDDHIVALDGRSSSTWEDAQALDRFLQREPGATVAVVTNDLHTRRARWVLNRTLGPDARQVFLVSAPLDEFGPHNWWHSRLGLHRYAAEYMKLTFYWVRYGEPMTWSCIVLLILLCLYGSLRGVSDSPLRV